MLECLNVECWSRHALDAKLINYFQLRSAKIPNYRTFFLAQKAYLFDFRARIFEKRRKNIKKWGMFLREKKRPNSAQCANS